LRLGDTGVIDAAIPRGRADTLYRRLGDLPFLALLLGPIILTFGLRGARALKTRRNAV
jgi:apolipoprotein N-acyltransferase